MSDLNRQNQKRTDQLLSVKNFKFSYDIKPSQETWWLNIPELHLLPNMLYLLRGDNMSGKSTLLNILAGIEHINRLSRQEIFVHGKHVMEQSTLINHILLISNNDVMLPELSIWDNIRISLPRLLWRFEESIESKCAQFFKASEMLWYQGINKPLNSLSTGGKSLIQLTRAWFSLKSVILIDELTSYLDDTRSYFFLDGVIGLVKSPTEKSGATQYLNLTSLQKPYPENGRLDGTPRLDFNSQRSVLIVSHNERDRSYISKKAKNDGIGINEFHISRELNISTLKLVPYTKEGTKQ